MTFDKWWAANMDGKGVDAARPLIEIAWNASADFQRERCAKIAKSSQEEFVREKLTHNDPIDKWVAQALGRMSHYIAKMIREV